MLFANTLKGVEGKKNAPVTITLRGGVKEIHGDVLKVDDGIVTMENGVSHGRKKHLIDLTEIVIVSPA